MITLHSHQFEYEDIMHAETFFPLNENKYQDFYEHIPDHKVICLMKVKLMQHQEIAVYLDTIDLTEEEFQSVGPSVFKQMQKVFLGQEEKLIEHERLFIQEKELDIAQ